MFYKNLIIRCIIDFQLEFQGSFESSLFEFYRILSRVGSITMSGYTDLYSGAINIKNKRGGRVPGIETGSIYIRPSYHVYKRAEEFWSAVGKVRKM